MLQRTQSTSALWRRRDVLNGAVAAAALSPAAACGAPYSPQQVGGDRPVWRKLSPTEARTGRYARVGCLGAWRGEVLKQHFGTAWACCPGRAATAAHVVRDACDYLRRLPSEERVLLRFGYVRGQGALEDVPLTESAFSAHPDFHADRDPFDVGKITIPVEAGLMRMAAPVLERFSAVEVCGYPAGRSWGPLHNYIGDQLVSAVSAGERKDAFLVYAADTYNGHSGGPVFWTGPSGGVEAVAVHVGHYGETGNKGVWIDEEIARFLRS